MLANYLGPTADEDETPNLVRADEGMVFAYNNLEAERDRLRVENEKLKAEIERLREALRAIDEFRYETDSKDAMLLAGWAKQALQSEVK